MRGVRTKQDLPQAVPQEWALRNVDIKYRESVCEAILRILRQPVAMRRHQGKDAKNTLRTRELCSFRNIDASVLNDKVGARNGNSFPPLRTVKRLSCRGESFRRQDCPAKDRPGVPVVRPHPISGGRGACGFEADNLRRRLILRMPIEAVVVAATAQMEK